MSVEELEAGLRWLFAETYSTGETRLRQRRYVAQARAGGIRPERLKPVAAPSSIPAPSTG
jgi:hypothetical protein